MLLKLTVPQFLPDDEIKPFALSCRGMGGGQVNYIITAVCQIILELRCVRWISISLSLPRPKHLFDSERAEDAVHQHFSWAGYSQAPVELGGRDGGLAAEGKLLMYSFCLAAEGI